MAEAASEDPGSPEFVDGPSELADDTVGRRRPRRAVDDDGDDINAEAPSASTSKRVRRSTWLRGEKRDRSDDGVKDDDAGAGDDGEDDDEAWEQGNSEADEEDPGSQATPPPRKRVRASASTRMSQQSKGNGKGSRSRKRSREQRDDDDDDDDEEANGNLIGGETQVSDLSLDKSVSKHMRPGMIIRTVMRNFMCHKNWTFEPGDSVNFIGGENGSGKSAIVAALQVALGVRAQKTGRGARAASLVGPEVPYSEIEVTLCNRGQVAGQGWKEDEYGPFLTVFRRITKTGAVTFRINDHNGKKVSTKTSELREMLDFFNVQVSNPMCVQLQHETKSLLLSGKSKFFYKHFMACTSLDRVRSSIADIKGCTSALDSTLSKMAGRIRKMEVTFREKERDWAELRAIRDVMSNIEKWEKQLAWAIVDDYSQRRQRALAERDALQQKIPHEESSLEAVGESLKKNTILTDKKRKELDDISARVRSKQRDLRMVHASIDRIETGQEGALHRLASLERSIAKAEKQQGRILKTIQGMREKQEHAEDIAVQQHRSLVAKKRVELEKATEQYEAAAKKLHDLEQAEIGNGCAHLIREKEHSERELQNARNAEAEVRQHLQQTKQMAGGASDRLSMYPKAHDMQRELEKAKQQFHGPFFGPVGVALTLDQPEWEGPVGKAISSKAGTYLIGDRRDLSTMTRVMDKVFGRGGRKPTIQVQPMGRGRLQPRENVPNGVTTLLSVMSTDNDDVYNWFVNESAPTTALVRDDVQARRVLGAGNRAGLLGPQAVRWVAFDDSTQYMQRSRTYSSFVMHKSAQNTRNLFARDLSTEVERLAARQRELQAGVANWQRGVDDFDRRIRVATNRLAAARREVERLDNARQLADVDLSELVQTGPQREIFDTTGHEEMLELEKQREADLREELENHRSSMSSTDEELDPLKQQEAQLQQEIAELGRLEGPVMEDIEELIAEVPKIHKLRQVLTTRITELQEQARVKEAEAAQVQTVLEEATATANEVSPERPEEVPPINEIKEKLVGARQLVIQEEQMRGRNLEEVTFEYEQAKEMYENARDLSNRQSQLKNTLIKAYKQRHAAWKATRTAIKERSLALFGKFMSSRNHAGTLSWNDEEKTLDIMVKINGLHNAEAEEQNLTTLSGGERSFVGVCFLLALWGSMECPFRIVDEFDIFMDNATREICMEMIRHHASGSDDQYLFLSPGDHSVFNKHRPPRAKLFLLHPPQRGLRASVNA